MKPRTQIAGKTLDILKLNKQDIDTAPYPVLREWVEYKTDESDVLELDRTQELGTALHFGDAIEPLIKVRNLLLLIDEDDVDPVFSPQEASISSVYKRFFTLLVTIAKYKASDNNAVGRRNSLISDSKLLLADTFRELKDVLNYKQLNSTVSAQQNNLEEFKEQAEGVMSQLQAELAAARLETNKAVDLRSQAEDAALAAQRASGIAGAEAHQEIFADAAKRHRETANVWLFVLVLSLAASVVSVFAFDPMVTKMYGENLSGPVGNPLYTYLSIKFLYFGLMLFLVIFARKNYAANKHNEVVNQHRADAMSTFDALAQASIGDETRDAILQAASTSIFSHQDSGHSNNRQGPNTSEVVPRIVMSTPMNQG